jgi:hypothetical protein
MTKLIGYLIWKGASECLLLNAKMINVSDISWCELATFYEMTIYIIMC